MIPILLYFVVLFLVLLWYCQNYYEGVDSPPPAGGAIPIVGHSWLGFVKTERLYELILNTVLGRSLEKNEETVYCRLGSAKIFVCLDPDDGYLLVNSCLKKEPFYKFFNCLVGGDNGLIQADVPTWKIHRKLLNPTMNQSVLDTYLIQFNEQSQQLVSLLSKEVGKGYFDPSPHLKETVFHTVCATMMGVSVDDDEELIKKLSDSVETITGSIVERSLIFYYHSDFIFNLSNLKKKQDAAADIYHTLCKKIIKQRKVTLSAQDGEETNTSSSRFKSFLDQLLHMGKDGVLSESEIQQEVNTFILGAFDTTYNALGMILLAIGTYPEVQRKMFDELQAVFESSTRNVEKQDMSKLKYLEAVVKETMRLYPVVVGIGRFVEKDLKLKRHTLPAGSRCFMSIYHAGRHRSWGADAAQFRPERWLDGSLPRSAAAYAVFGLGKRSCIGSNFAMMLMKTVLCHVVRHYRISGDVTRVVLNFNIVVTPFAGHHLTLERRDTPIE